MKHPEFANRFKQAVAHAGIKDSQRELSTFYNLKQDIQVELSEILII